jgi:hypothetical protein
VGFDPTIPVFEGAKTTHALDRKTTVMGKACDYIRKRKQQEFNGIYDLFLCTTSTISMRILPGLMLLDKI